MLNDTSKSAHRPYVKKKTAKDSKPESPSEARRRDRVHNPRDKKSKGSGISFGGLSGKSKSSELNDFEPDKRTQRAASKKQYNSDRFQGFASTHARAIIVLAAVIISVWLMYPAVKGYYASKRNFEIYTAVADYIATSNAEIEAKIESLNSEEGIKAQARERGLVEPGEIAIVIQEPKKPESNEGAEGDSSDPLSPVENKDAATQEDQAQDASKPASKGVKEKEKIQKIAESIRDEGSPMQKTLDYIFGYTPPDVKVF